MLDKLEFFVCRLWVSNLERSTYRVLYVVIGTPKPSSRQYYGVRGKRQLLIKSYLTEREQYVNFCGYELTCEKVDV